MTETAEPDWARIRVEYEAGEISIADLVANHNIKRNQLNYRRQKGLWALRTPVTGRQRSTSLLRRMLGIFASQITRLEHKLNEEPMSATEMRMLESMAKAIERIRDIEAAEKKTSKPRERMDPELEAIRERLAQRIEDLDVED